MDSVEPEEFLNRAATFFRQGKNGRASLSLQAYIDSPARTCDTGLPDLARAMEAGDFLLIADICDELRRLIVVAPLEAAQEG